MTQYLCHNIFSSTLIIEFFSQCISLSIYLQAFGVNHKRYDAVAFRRVYSGKTRAVRIIPLTYVRQACMRVQFWGEGELFYIYFSLVIKHNSCVFKRLSRFCLVNLKNYLKLDYDILHDKKIISWETHHDFSISDELGSVESYDLIRADRDRSGSGVCMYVTCNINYKKCIYCWKAWTEN